MAGLNVSNFFGDFSSESNRCFVAFTVCEWNFDNRTIFISQMSPRSVFLKTIDGYVELLKRTVSQVNIDAQLYFTLAPLYLWCWVNSDHSRLSSIPQRMKFIEKSQFLERNASVDPSIFEKDGFEYLKDERAIVYVSGTTEFIE